MPPAACVSCSGWHPVGGMVPDVLLWRIVVSMCCVVCVLLLFWGEHSLDAGLLVGSTCVRWFVLRAWAHVSMPCAAVHDVLRRLWCRRGVS